MAQTTALSASISYNGGILASLTGTISVTQTGTDATAQVQSIGFAAAELIDLGSDIGTLGYIMIKNLDATNFVELSLNDFTQKFAKLRPGEFILLPVSSNTIYAKADTGAVEVGYVAIEL